MLCRATGVFSFFIALVFTALQIVAASAKDYPPDGGPDGGAFPPDRCPAGQYLVGVTAHTGYVVDQIAITCAVVNADGTTTIKYHGQPHGGPGGGVPAAPTTCDNHKIITNMGLLTGRMAPHTVVRMITFNCASTAANDGSRVNLDIGQAPLFATINQPCDPGEAAVGLVGRTGTYVDALGLLCGPFTKVGEPTPPPVTADGCAGLTGDLADICNEHNVERKKHGVPPLTWSKDLAANAQAWVNGCHTSKNSNGDEFFCHQSPQYGCGTDAAYGYGENLSFGWPTRSGKEAVDGWYCEINVYNFDNPTFQGGTMFGCDNNPDKVDGHFTQVVWKATKNVGCASAQCSLGGNTGTLWACEYDPPGNYNVDQPGVLAANVPRPIRTLAGDHLLSISARPQKMTAIISDVDLYDVPGGNGRVIGVLRRGQQYPLVGCKPDDWCQLSEGWVWGSFIVRNHSRAESARPTLLEKIMSISSRTQR